MLEKEADAARNVKCRTNRQLILQAIGSCQYLVSQFSKTDIPPNGLAIFAGGEENHRYLLLPPRPILKNTYLCDKRYFPELIAGLYDEHQETVGYIIVQGEDALFATVCGTQTTLLGTTLGHLLGDTRRGGQSAPRFGRIAEGRRENYAKRIGEKAWDLFGPNSSPSRRVHRLILGGPAGVKSRVLKGWHPELPEPIVVTLSRGGEEGLRECMNKAADLLAYRRVKDDDELLREFYHALDRTPDTLVVGNELPQLYHQGLLKAIWTTDISSLGPEFGLDPLDAGEEGEPTAVGENDSGVDYVDTDEETGDRRPGRKLRYGTRLYVVAATSELGTQFEREYMGLAAISWTTLA